jgi:GDPmannose 4,6-dehydratase
MKALISGITGQDGSYLAEFLLHKGYEVHGMIRRASTFNTGRIDHIFNDLHLHYGDMSDTGQLTNLIYNIKPDEVYHLAAQSHVRVSFDIPEYTGNVTGLGTTRLLEVIRHSGLPIKVYLASSSEMFGSVPPPQNEITPFHPQSPYGCAKLYSYWTGVNYRYGYNMFICNGILFNHESPRRGETFVTRKVTRAIANIITGRQKHLYLGNLKTKRDWGFAPEYVEAMWLMLQMPYPNDYIIGTGTSHSVREFIDCAFAYAGIELEGSDIIKTDNKYFRPTEVNHLQADPSKARYDLDWVSAVNFYDLVKIMVDYDLIAHGLKCPGEGVKICQERFPYIKEGQSGKE